MEFEVVIPNCADKINFFLESFEQRIKHTDVKRVTKIGMSEWELSGNWFTKGRVIIFPRRNDVVCRVKTEIDKTAFFGVVPLVRTQSAQSKLEREVRRAIENAKIIVFEESSTKSTSTMHVGEKKFDCPGCGRSLHRDMNFCPFCGLKIERCIVCNIIIFNDQEIVECPYCAGSAHRDHLLEYLKIKGQCPSCGKELKQYELV